MRSVTGIELGPESCVLVRVRPGRDGALVSAVYGLEPHEQPAAHETLSGHLRAVRRRRRLPRRARVVAWGLHASASPTDAATIAGLAPLREAGFVIDDVLTPAEALAALSRHRPPVPGRGATAWLAVNRHGVAIAIVDRGDVLYAREIDWNYRSASTTREELLQRYSLVAHLAPELGHGFDVVRTGHGVRVDSVVTCGDLPDLRSLTMPLTEEIDIEVETLDSLEGLKVVSPAANDRIEERSPALRLACAAAIGRAPGTAAPESRSRVAAAAAAAAMILIALVGWAAYFRGAEVEPPRAVPPTPAPVARQPPSVPPAASTRAPLPDPPAASGKAAVQDRDTTRPAATMGRQETAREPVEAPTAAPTARTDVSTAVREGEARRQATPRTAVPLSDPMPAVNSILVGPDRRLAVLDGSIVREGDVVGRRMVVRIESGAVVLREPSGHEVRVLIRRRVGS
jgi:hypothetical protein